MIVCHQRFFVFLVLAAQTSAEQSKADTSNDLKRECVNVGGRRVEFDERCVKNDELYGCGAGAQITGCRFCGEGIYPDCPSDFEVDSRANDTDTTLFENDILLLNQTVDEFLANFIDVPSQVSFDSVQKNKLENAVRSKRLLWPNGYVPFTISNRFDIMERNTILSAMSRIEERTCLRFYQRTNEYDYINFYRGRGCYSTIGHVGGSQPLSLGNYCVYVGTAIHEIMHALGFYHEQSRADRDQYVIINWSNIYPGQRFNFQKYTLREIDHLGQPYDYSSIMHYSSTEFSYNGYSPTITARDRNVRLTHASRKTYPSDTDYRKLNILYSCNTAYRTTLPPRTYPPRTYPPATTRAPRWYTTTTSYPTACYDSDAYCEGWARIGYCARDNRYMRKHCRLSCGRCSHTG